ncbi:50S ribosomal protein L25 [Gorillibacterium timonense]|uniref:50S ribosomal protein L25 n=1 Tax=Gorillibacterium timonense TaxID=1689269 RepID=UPI00071DA052|nr:50S ribosomal protein L25 [Gorillibacterium timonense]
MSIQLKAEIRTGKTRSAIRGLRNGGRVPASVYGKKISSGESISVEEKELGALLRKNPHAIIDLIVGGEGAQPVIINEIQKDKMSGKVLHVDFHQISMDEPIHSALPVELVGTAAGVKEGGILTVESHQVEIRCLPKDLPASLSVDISELGIGDSIHVSSIQLPEGVELISESTDVIASVLAPQKADESDAGEAPKDAPVAAPAAEDNE